MTARDDQFEEIERLVMCHSPSGVEHEIDAVLLAQLAQLGIPARLDPSGNIIGFIAGRPGAGTVAISAHKDEIGASVTSVSDDGILRVRKLGGSYPWIYGEGVVDLLGDQRVVEGILSFGSRHISHASPQHAQQESAPVRWSDTWVETKLSGEALRAAGVRVGTRMVVGKHRKRPLRLGDHVASYALDNKASIAILLALARNLVDPALNIHVLFSSKEEIGAVGAMYFSQHSDIDALIALEVAPLSGEYEIVDSEDPVLIVEDGVGLYHDALNQMLMRSADEAGIRLQLATVQGFGSDGSIAMKAGNVPRAACLGFPTQNTHGYEIARLAAIANCTKILEAFCARSLPEDWILARDAE